ncbi:MAG: hypothetical protein V5A66_03895 [Candidatus Thermoplasmatota archaeon]
MFYHDSFLNLLILEVPPHELYIRIVWMLMLILFGVLISREMRKREDRENRIVRLNDLLEAIGDVNQMLLQADRAEEMIDKACELLHERRGYYNVWMVLFDDDEKTRYLAEAGLGEKKEKLEEMIKSKRNVECIELAKEKEGLISIEEPSSRCSECLLSDKYEGRGSFVMGLRYRGKIYGVISASVQRKYIDDEKERSLFKELAGDISYGLYNLEIEKEREEMVERERFLHSLLRHDLKNKLQVVQGYLQMLEEEGLTGDPKEYLEKAMIGFEKGMEILEKIRKLRDVGEEKIKDISVEPVLKDVVTEHEPEADDNGLQIDLKIEDMDEKVRGGKLLDEL